jgi:hypothetical protein
MDRVQKKEHRSSIVACVYIAGIVEQQPQFTESPLSNWYTCYNTNKEKGKKGAIRKRQRMQYTNREEKR